jgi:hypothetical protein
MSSWWLNALWSLTPTIALGLIFWLVLRAILRADRNERRAYREMEAKERARLGLPPREASDPVASARSASEEG